MKRRMTRRGKIVIIAFAAIVIIVLYSTLHKNKSSDSVPVQKNSPAAEVTDIPAATESSTAADTVSQTTTLPPQMKLSGCTSAMAYCLENDTLLFSQDADRSIAPASLTKLLTACTALNYISPDTCCTVGSEQYLVQPESSLCYISQGQQITAEDLIAGMMMASSNDAAYALAVNTARKVSADTNMTDYQAVEYFCGLMNSFATELGMKNSNFVSPDGWDTSGQYTTASDLLILARYAAGVPEIRKAADCYEKQVTILSGEGFTWHNSNKLLDPYSEFYRKDASGLKTGSTVSAGNNLIAVFEINGLTYLTVVTGCESDYDRYYLTLQLINEYT